MTRKLLVLSALQLVGFGLFAQQQTTTTRTAELKPVKLQAAQSTGTEKSVNTSQDSLSGESLEHLNYVIYAIDSKVAYVKADEAENQKALESGWYDMMAKQREILVAKREILIQRQSQEK